MFLQHKTRLRFRRKEMKLYYADIKESCYLENTDEIEEYGDDFEFIPDEEKKNRKLAELLTERYFTGLNVNDEQQEIIKKGMVGMVEEMGDEELKSWEEFFRDELTEAFEEEAFDE